MPALGEPHHVAKLLRHVPQGRECKAGVLLLLSLDVLLYGLPAVCPAWVQPAAGTRQLMALRLLATEGPRCTLTCVKELAVVLGRSRCAWQAALVQACAFGRQAALVRPSCCYSGDAVQAKSWGALTEERPLQLSTLIMQPVLLAAACAHIEIRTAEGCCAHWWAHFTTTRSQTRQVGF